MREEEKKAIEMIKEQKEEIEYGINAMECTPEDYNEDVYNDYVEWNKNAETILNLIEKQQKEIEKLKEYKKQSIPLYKIIDKLDDLELSEELQEKWDNFMSGSEAVTKAYKELIIESKGEKE